MKLLIGGIGGTQLQRNLSRVETAKRVSTQKSLNCLPIVHDHFGAAVDPTIHRHTQVDFPKMSTPICPHLMSWYPRILLNP